MVIITTEAGQGTGCGDACGGWNVKAKSVVGLINMRISVILLASPYWGPHIVRSTVAVSTAVNNDNNDMNRRTEDRCHPSKALFFL